MPKVQLTHDGFQEDIVKAKQKTIAQTAFRETGIAWLGNEEGTVIIPPNERRHPAEAFWAYSDINGTRQVIRLANYDSSLTYSNKDVRRAVRIGIPPGEELLGVLGIATQDAKVFGSASPVQVLAKKLSLLTPDRWQMLRLSAAGGRRVNVEAGWYYDNGLVRHIPPGELIDLDGYYPTNPGETRIVMLGWTELGTTRLLQGDVFTRVAGDPIYNHFPTDPFEEGDVPLGGAILTYGETELVQARLLPYLPFFEAIRTNIVNEIDVNTIQGFLFFNEGTAYQVHCVGDQVSPPTATDDETSTPHPFGVLSLWAMSVTAGAAEDALYVCVDPTEDAAVWLRLDGTGGGGAMDDFTVAADSGTPAVIGDGETVTLAGGTGLSTAIAGNTVTLSVDADGISNTELANMPALTVKARIVNSAGDPSDLAFSADGQFLVRRSGALTVDTLVAADIPNLAASKITSGQLALARGGTNADLSATGGANQVVMQESAGAAFTVRVLAAADIPNLAASKITSGQLALARGGTGADLSATGGSGYVVKQGSAGAVFTVGAITSAEIATALSQPPTIGGTTPATGAFTFLQATNRLVVNGTATSGNNAASITAAVTNITGVNISPVVTTNVDADLVDMLGSVTPTANLNGVYGVRFTATIAGSSSFNVAFLAGMSGQVGLGASYGGTITYAIAGYFGDVVKPGTGTITNQIGVYIPDQTKGSTKVGLQIDQTTGFAIYCGGAGAVYFAGTTTANGTLTIGGTLDHNGSTVAFYNQAGTTRQTITGSRGGNAALASLLTALAATGLIIDSTS